MTVRPNVRAMSGYVPGEQLNDPEIVKLNTNENPYPPSPRVFEAVRAALTPNSLRKYPQPLGDTFRKAAGRVLNVDPDGILIGNGSDDILTILTRAFVPEGGLIASPTPSYILYKSLAEIQGARFAAVPLTADWQPDADRWPRDAHLSFVPNPNSPSGTVIAAERLAALAGLVSPAPFVCDEAYADFADDNSLALLPSTPNLIVTRTMSKSYALAGIRFGFAVSRPELVRELVKVKDSYNCDVLSLAAATAAIEDQDYFRHVCAKIRATRDRMTTDLTALGFEVTPSHANFVWCRRADRPLKPIYEALKSRKILVRYMSYAAGPVGHPEGSAYDGLRISVGTDTEIDQLCAALRVIL
ncbi:histidinol-phosphate transaminase [Gemmata sp. JC717]|uniref:histidinol-phosphate transaminase n=1 Tax=Gemmata algarum TaxID=2975278 RepID=UPI0021BAE691|nr:histidinol-phosphate transaminase [Gemmata algarum]MDY3556775.1 histidinol-phosphate transaminase [Gemmata algarum]